MTSREFLFALPSKVSPAAIEGLATVFHFDLEGDNGGQFTIRVADQKDGYRVHLNGYQGDMEPLNKIDSKQISMCSFHFIIRRK